MITNSTKSQKHGVLINVQMCCFELSNPSLVEYEQDLSIILLYTQSTHNEAKACLYSGLVEWVMPKKNMCAPLQSANDFKHFLDVNGFEFVRGCCDNKFLRQATVNPDNDYESEFFEDGAFCGFSFPRIVQHLSKEQIEFYTNSDCLGLGKLTPDAVWDATSDTNALLISPEYINQIKNHLPEMIGQL